MLAPVLDLANKDTGYEYELSLGKEVRSKYNNNNNNNNGNGSGNSNNKSNQPRAFCAGSVGDALVLEIQAVESGKSGGSGKVGKVSVGKENATSLLGYGSDRIQPEKWEDGHEFVVDGHVKQAWIGQNH